MNRVLVVERERETHNKGLGVRIGMDSDIMPLRHTVQYKQYTFAKNGERKIDTTPIK